MPELRVNPTTIEQCQRWLAMLTQFSGGSEWSNFESRCRAFIGFSRTIGVDASAAAILVELLKQEENSIDFRHLLEVLDHATERITAGAKSHACVFPPGLPSLDERSHRLTQYLENPHEWRFLGGPRSESVGLRLRGFLVELLSTSVDFQKPIAEVAILYVFGTALMNSSAGSHYGLLENPDQIPFTFELLTSCCDSVLNLLRVREGKSFGGPLRAKSDKFGILDTPSLLVADLAASPGALGTACIYLDVDNFKSFNTRFSERTVDQALLVPLQRLLSTCIDGIGHAYAEGGDEMTLLLPNATLDMAIAFIKAVRQSLDALVFTVGESSLRLTISAGIAHSEPGGDRTQLPEQANLAMRAAKDRGKNRVFVYTPDRRS